MKIQPISIKHTTDVDIINKNGKMRLECTSKDKEILTLTHNKVILQVNRNEIYKALNVMNMLFGDINKNDL